MPAQTNTLSNIKDIPTSAWEKLAAKNFYFGHQSVGFNIIDGLKDLMKEYPRIKLNIVETSDPADFKNGIFAHSRVGENGSPESKIKDFINVMESGIGDKADYAFFKFCYIDFNRDTDIDGLFRDYKNAMSSLRSRYTKTTFIHITVPLVAMNMGIKDYAKKLMGRSIKDPEANIKRNLFNKMLRDKYTNKEPLFDLAAAESTLPDGKRVTFTNEGKKYYSLAPQYTSDGGHLNDIGRKIVSEKFISYLATLCK